MQHTTLIKFGHACAQIKFKKQKAERIRHLSVTALQLHKRKARPATFKKMTQSQVFACKFCNTLKNSCYQEDLWTIAEISFWQQGIGTVIPFALTPFWVCKLKRFLLFSINFFLLTTYCGFTVQKNKFHENFPRAIFNWKPKRFLWIQ